MDTGRDDCGTMMTGGLAWNMKMKHHEIKRYGFLFADEMA